MPYLDFHYDIISALTYYKIFTEDFCVTFAMFFADLNKLVETCRNDEVYGCFTFSLFIILGCTNILKYDPFLFPVFVHIVGVSCEKETWSSSLYNL
jgi:hypothetical protein